MGKLLSLAFVPFAGWFSGNVVPVRPVPAVPGRRAGQPLRQGRRRPCRSCSTSCTFPPTSFELFLPVDTMTGRFGTLLAAVHTIVQALLAAVAVAGAIQLRPGLRFCATARSPWHSRLRCSWALRLYFEHVVPQEYRAYQQIVHMDLAIDRVATRLLEPERIEPLPRTAPATGWPSFRRAARCESATRPTACLGSLPMPRAGWWASTSISPICSPPTWGRDRIRHGGAGGDGACLDDGRVDLVVRGVWPVTPERALRVRFTEPYMDATLALVVRDHDRRRFATLPRSARRVRCGSRRPTCRTRQLRARRAAEGRVDPHRVAQGVLRRAAGTLRRLAHDRGRRLRVDAHPSAIQRGGPETQRRHRTDRLCHAEERAGAARLRQHLGRAQARGRHHAAPVRLLDPRSRCPADRRRAGR